MPNSDIWRVWPCHSQHTDTCGWLYLPRVYCTYSYDEDWFWLSVNNAITTVCRSPKPPQHSLSPRLRKLPSNFVFKLTARTVKILSCFVSSEYFRVTDDIRHILTIAELYNAINGNVSPKRCWAYRPSSGILCFIVLFYCINGKTAYRLTLINPTQR